MDTLKSTKVDWKKITVVGALVILTGLIVGLVTWYIMDDLSAKEAETYQNQITSLETQNKKLQEDYEACNETMTVTEDELDEAVEEVEDAIEEAVEEAADAIEDATTE